MPADNTTQPTVPDPRDKRIADLEAQVAKLQADLASKKDRAAPKLPEGVVILAGGKQLQIERTVQAKFALDEVKKGYLEEDAELIVTKRA